MLKAKFFFFIFCSYLYIERIDIFAKEESFCNKVQDMAITSDAAGKDVSRGHRRKYLSEEVIAAGIVNSYIIANKDQYF